MVAFHLGYLVLQVGTNINIKMDTNTFNSLEANHEKKRNKFIFFNYRSDSWNTYNFFSRYYNWSIV